MNCQTPLSYSSNAFTRTSHLLEVLRLHLLSLDYIYTQALLTSDNTRDLIEYSLIYVNKLALSLESAYHIFLIAASSIDSLLASETARAPYIGDPVSVSGQTMTARAEACL